MKFFALFSVLTFAVTIHVHANPATRSTTKPATTSPSAHADQVQGSWKLDRDATVTRAVNAEPAAKKEEVRKLLTQRLPDQLFVFGTDGKFTIISQVPGEMEMVDSGTFVEAENAIRLVSTRGGAERVLTRVFDGKTMIIHDVLVFNREK